MKSTDTLQPILSYDEDAICCPYPFYKKLRGEGRIAYDSNHDIYIVSHYADIAKINTRPATFSNANPMGPAIIDAMQRLESVLARESEDFQQRAMTVLSRGNVLFTADPPEHSRHRRILNAALTPTAIRKLEPLVEAYCHQLIDGLENQEEFDFVSAYATPAPIFALAKLLGIPADRTSDFYDWASAINATIGTNLSDQALLHALRQQMVFWTFFEGEIERRRGDSGDDLLYRIVNARPEGDAPLSLEEMVGFCAQLIGAGADTTTKLIAAAIDALCRNRSHLAALRSDPDKIPNYLEEILRLEPPVQGMFRVTTEAVEVLGAELPAGATIWCLYASGNRDDSVFDKADECLLDRSNGKQHLSFGFGPHICIGANLARAVSKIALSTWLGRMDSFQLANPRHAASVEPSYIMHGFRELLLRK